MSTSPRQTIAPPFRGLAIVAVLCAVVVASCSCVQAWHWIHQDRGDFAHLRGAIGGSLCGVMLVNSQMYYGTLVDSGSGFVRLADVYYVQTLNSANSSENRLVSRRKTDWHGPEWMEIPSDKILFIEKVGKDSKLAGLISQDKSAP